MWPEIYYDSRNIIHVMTHDCISFPGPSSSAGKLMRVCTSIVTASNGFLLFFSFSFWLFYFNIDVFASAMIDYVCFCVVWNFYQRYHSFPSLTLRALLSAPPTPSLIGWEAGPSILYLICLDIATPIIRKAHLLGLFEPQQIRPTSLFEVIPFGVSGNFNSLNLKEFQLW